MKHRGLATLFDCKMLQEKRVPVVAVAVVAAAAAASRLAVVLAAAVSTQVAVLVGELSVDVADAEMPVMGVFV